MISKPTKPAHEMTRAELDNALEYYDYLIDDLCLSGQDPLSAIEDMDEFLVESERRDEP